LDAVQKSPDPKKKMISTALIGHKSLQMLLSLIAIFISTNIFSRRQQVSGRGLSSGATSPRRQALKQLNDLLQVLSPTSMSTNWSLLKLMVPSTRPPFHSSFHSLFSASLSRSSRPTEGSAVDGFFFFFQNEKLITAAIRFHSAISSSGGLDLHIQFHWMALKDASKNRHKRRIDWQNGRPVAGRRGSTPEHSQSENGRRYFTYFFDGSRPSSAS
jgi:hypothetical protein